MKLPDFIKNATNIYRTKHFIIKQCMGFTYSEKQDNALYSIDTYYFRTKSRDKEFNRIMCDRYNIDGKRLPATMVSKKYVK